MMTFLLPILMAACTQPVVPVPDAAPHPPTPYGGFTSGSGLVLPRTALAHLTTSMPVPFETTEAGARLLMDETGLLGQIGLFARDEVLTSDVEALFDSWFSDDKSTFSIRRDDQVIELSVTWDGPAVVPSSAPMTSLGTQTETVALLAPEDRRVNRAILTLLPASTATPVRTNGNLIGYTLTGPVAQAIGVSQLHRVNGVEITSDLALWDAVDSWFRDSETTLESANETSTVRWVGLPATPPALWTLPVHVDDNEARVRAGIRLEDGGAAMPRSLYYAHLADTFQDYDLQPVDQEGIPLHGLLSREISDLLGLNPWQMLQAVDGTAIQLHTRDDYPQFEAARATLLTSDGVTLTFEDIPPFRLRLDGPPTELPDDWTPPAVVPPPYTRGVQIAETITVDRMALRRLIAEPPNCRPGRRVPPSCGAHPLWTALALPYGAITHLNGETFDSFHQIPLWVDGLCSATRASIASELTVTHRVEFDIRGSAVPCP